MGKWEMWDSKIFFKPSTIREPSKCCVGVSKNTGNGGNFSCGSTMSHQPWSRKLSGNCVANGMAMSDTTTHWYCGYVCGLLVNGLLLTNRLTWPWSHMFMGFSENVGISGTPRSAESSLSLFEMVLWDPLGSIPYFHTLPRVHGISLTRPFRCLKPFFQPTLLDGPILAAHLPQNGKDHR